MTLKSHIIIGGAASAALYPVLGVDCIFFWFASFLIDIDHYLDFLYHNGFKDWSPRRMFDYHKVLVRHWHSPAFLNIEIFHTVEFLAALYAVAVLTGSAGLKAVFWGFIFHNLLDIIFLAKKGILFKRAYSFTEYFIRKRAMRLRGLCPSSLCTLAVSTVRNSCG